MNMAGFGSGIKGMVSTAKGLQDLFLDPARLGLQGEQLNLSRDELDWQKALGERKFDLEKRGAMQDILDSEQKRDWQRKFRNALLGIK